MFSLGDSVLESLFCAQRLWLLNLCLADTEKWASSFALLRDYNFWTFQIQYVVLGPRKTAMPLVRDFSENDKIFRREKKYVD